MATTSPDVPAGQSESLAASLPGMPSFLFDPARAAKYVHRKWFWVGPLVVFSLVIVNAAKEWWAETVAGVEVIPRAIAKRPAAMRPRMTSP